MVRKYNALDLMRAQPVHLTGPYTSFGDLAVGQLDPIVQIDATYGLRSLTDTEVFTGGSGTATVEDTGTGYEYKCASSSTVGSYGIVRSQRVIRYRPGQGTLFRWTARYGTPVALSGMRAGPSNIGVELTFGYNGTRFGILYRTGGKQDLQLLTLTVGASGAETASIELNGITYEVDLTAGTTSHNAFEIANDSQFGTDKAYSAHQNNGTVTFTASAIGVASGATSYSSDGDSAGSIAQTAAGAAAIDTWYYQGPEDGDSATQEYWNIDSMLPDPSGRKNDRNETLGTGPSGMVLDPSKGNVYQVQYQYLGYGQIRFYLEDDTGLDFQEVHRIRYPNNNTSPSLTLPNFKLSWFAFSAGTTTPVEMFGASGMGGIEGKIELLRNPDSHDIAQSYTTSGFKNIVSLRTRRVFADRINLTDFKPLVLSVASDGNKNVTWRLYINAVITGSQDWEYHKEASSIVEVDETLLPVSTDSNSQLVAAGVLAKEDSTIIDLKDYNLKLLPTQVLTLAAQSDAVSDIGSAITWTED